MSGTIVFQTFFVANSQKIRYNDYYIFIGVCMNKIILALVVVIFASCMSANAAGYCPAPQELQTKQVYWMKRASADNTLDGLDAIIKEQEAYMRNLLPNCLTYFKTTPNASCDKLATVAAAYMLVPKDQEHMAKLQILTSTAHHKTRCQYQFRGLQTLLK